MNQRVIVVICDGLWNGWLTSPPCNEIARILQQSCYCRRHRGIIPSVTRVTAASLVTGCFPAGHGLQGNKVALRNGQQQLEVFDVGKPEFITDLKELTGVTLLVPALSELLKEDGLFIAYSNVSPGAAYFLDPENHGYVYHRAGSLGPGGIPLDDKAGLNIRRGLAGDEAMTVRFCEDVYRRRPILSILWLGEPDTSLHAFAPQTSEAEAGIRSAAQNVSRVFRLAETLRNEGEDVLYLVGSDHGMDTANKIVYLESWLIAAGFKKAITDDSLVVATQGGSAAIYLKEMNRTTVGEIIGFLRREPWAGAIYADHEKADATLESVGVSNRHGLALFVNGASDGYQDLKTGNIPRWNFGRFGTGDELERAVGSHGYLDGPSMEPFLILNGAGFPSGSAVNQATGITDIAPTILKYFSKGIPAYMKGRPIQEMI
jgi:predicted AlkP superfamily pyrophosphatase or phosphodiesterase